MLHRHFFMQTAACFRLTVASSLLLIALVFRVLVSNWGNGYFPLRYDLRDLRPCNHSHPIRLTNQTAIALVFYGRRRYVQILHCYLEQNLVDNGGVLSSVMFLTKTNDIEDLAYVDSIIEKHPGRFFRKDIKSIGWTFKDHYQSLIPDQYYFKLDDDIVYIHPNTLGMMLQAKLTYSDVLFVSANVINHPVLGQVHAQMRAIHNLSNFENFQDTPHACHWESSRCGVLQHESFLKRYKDGSLCAYIFPLWDFHYTDTVENYNRWSINLILFRGKDVAGVDLSNDELQISHLIPMREKKHCVAVGEALAVHFAYGPQRANGLRDKTESILLEKYQRLANDSCTIRN
jgi:hypothetical protein